MTIEHDTTPMNLNISRLEGGYLVETPYGRGDQAVRQWACSTFNHLTVCLALIWVGDDAAAEREYQERETDRQVDALTRPIDTEAVVRGRAPSVPPPPADQPGVLLYDEKTGAAVALPMDLHQALRVLHDALVTGYAGESDAWAANTMVRLAPLSSVSYDQYHAALAIVRRLVTGR